MMQISQDRFERIVREIPSFSEEEKAAAIRHGVVTFIAHGKAVDRCNGPVSSVADPDGLTSNHAMMLTSIAEGRPGPWDRIA